jgi:cellulose biosynthesis protein BcsQ
MTKILAFFNHKGGVGKTTLAYNVAWGLSSEGKRVLMIDADSQCNLTEIAIGEDDLYNSEDYIQNNIYAYLSGYVLPDINKDLPQVKIVSKKENLQLLSGALRFAELEETIALSIAGINALRHVPTSMYQALRDLGNSVDWIVLDMSPALSATNQLLLMLSDYFVVPVNPSIFSRQALQNLNEIFRGWNRNLSSFDIFSRKIKRLPQMLGIVCQNYRLYSRKEEDNTKSAKRFEDRMCELNNCAIGLATDLNSFGMAITPVEFACVFPQSTPYRIANIPDYNQLATVSETEKIPVNGLDSKILNQYKINTKQYTDKLNDFKGQCDRIVQGLLKLS